MQVAEVLTGTHDDIVNQLNVLAASAEIQVLQKTASSGQYVVVYDDAGTTGQTAVVIIGDPTALADELQSIITLGGVIDLVSRSFSAAHYVAVYS